MMAGRAEPDRTLVAELRLMVAEQKLWVAPHEIDWVDAGGRPKGMKFRHGLAMDGGLQPESLFVQGYFKPSMLDEDKLSLGLFYKNHRIVGLDEDGVAKHRNDVGRGRLHFGNTVDHPHLHSISDDGIDGYAEPIPRTSYPDYWAEFLRVCNIANGPDFYLPPVQRELLPP